MIKLEDGTSNTVDGICLSADDLGVSRHLTILHVNLTTSPRR